MSIVRCAWARIAGRWTEQPLVELDERGMRLVPDGATDAGDHPYLDRTVLPPITDAHVHLGLSDSTEPGCSALARVLDLGWDAALLPELLAGTRSTHAGVDVRFAGPFHTAVGGYPADRAWAPHGAVVQLADPHHAVASVRTQADAGASMIKLALNAEAGPVPDDAVLRALVAAAHDAGLPVAAHAQGARQVEGALGAGVDVLAHTPWTERLSDAVIRSAAESQTWISTLAMHERDGDARAFGRALENLARFVAAGGAVAYGTDLGNGLARFDLDAQELAALRRAGVGDSALVDALLSEALLPAGPTLSFFPSDVVDDDGVLAALHRSEPMRITELELA